MNSNEKDIQLVKKASEGDHLAFRQIVEMHKVRSLSLAISIIKDREKAEDVLQDAFIKVYQNLKSFRQDSNFSTWLYRIVVNTAYNQLKKYRFEMSLDETIPVETKQKLQNGGFEQLLENEKREFINLALQKLKPDEALTLRLFYLCEMHIPEIEEITGFSSSKIKVNLHRGRKELLFKMKMMLGKELKELL